MTTTPNDTLAGLIEAETRYPGIPTLEPITARPMTLRDHLDIETEGATSPRPPQPERVSTLAKALRDDSELDALWLDIMQLRADRKRAAERLARTRGELEALQDELAGLVAEHDAIGSRLSAMLDTFNARVKA